MSHHNAVPLGNCSSPDENMKGSPAHLCPPALPDKGAAAAKRARNAELPLRVRPSMTGEPYGGYLCNSDRCDLPPGTGGPRVRAGARPPPDSLAARERPPRGSLSGPRGGAGLGGPAGLRCPEPAGRGGLWGGRGPGGRRARAARLPRPRGTSALRVQGSGAESRFVPVCSFSLFFQTALSWAGRVPPTSRSRAGRLGSLPASPRFPRGWVRARGAGGGGLRAQPPAPPGSSDRASARAEEVARGILGHPCCGTATAVEFRLAWQGGKSHPGAVAHAGTLAYTAARTCGIHAGHDFIWSHTHAGVCVAAFLSQVLSSAANVEVDLVGWLSGRVNKAGLCPPSWLWGLVKGISFDNSK
ncbi:collagen alpha-1(I) chain-like [Manacus candei]|uniref:collagen alpha-1(I) chain-like n=1 Tax=Manacus candei TaxID=415023 RepID=UPI002227A8A4|nr:collagen alpha-1(I) chain-like [Manacus candei]